MGSRASGLVLRLGAAACLGLSGCGEAVDERPNVLLISIDTLRPDFLGCYGHPRETSPTLDAIADAGVLFEDVTSASPWTLPSHASMLTGLYPSSHGVKDHDRQLTRETLATRLKKAGFQTMAVVNSHNIGDKRYGLLRGFDESHYESEMDFDPDRPKKIGNKGDRITKRALRYLRERDETRPFFLFLHYYDVHTDFTPAPKWELEFVSSYDGKLTGVTQQLVNLRNNPKLTPTEQDIVWLEEMYEAEIRTLDETLAGLFDYLDAAGLADSTIVAVTSDHGEEYWEHESLLHGRTYYEEVIRIPLLLRGPGVPAGVRVPTPVHLVDLAPTLYSLVDVFPTEEPDGVDLTLAWTDPDALASDRLLFAEADHNTRIDGEEHSDVGRMVRVGSEKLCYDKLTGSKELYDLGEDPGEQRDLASERPERLQVLWKELERFLENDTGGGARELEPLDEETLQDLRKLGYFDGEDGAEQ